METPKEILDRIQDNLSINLSNPEARSPQDMLTAIHSGEVQHSLQSQAHNDNSMVTDFLGGSGIGFGSTLNNLVFGGAAQIFRNLGRAWETVSPFSGNMINDDKFNSLLRAGYSPEEINKLYPYQDSWLTQLSNNELETRKFFNQKLNDYRSSIIGDNPSMTAKTGQGVGSILAFILAGYAAHQAALAAGATPWGAALTGGLASGGLEALSESGSFLGDAYDKGKVDEGLSIANKNFLANLVLNTALDSTVGRFNPHIQKLYYRNPLLYWLGSGAAEVLNENLQEPSQNIIEQASNMTLDNPDSSFTGNLLRSVPNWWDTAKELAPEVTLSTIISHLLLGAGDSALQNYRTHRDSKKINAYTEGRDTGKSNTSSKFPNVPTYNDTINDFISNETRQSLKLPEITEDSETQIKPKDLIEQIQSLSNQYATGKDNDQINTSNVTIPEDMHRDFSNNNPSQTNTTPVDTTPVNTTTANTTPINTTHADTTTPVNTPTPQNTPPAPKKNINDVPSVSTLDTKADKSGSNVAKVRTMNGTEVDVRYRIIDADDLITSTKDTGGRNPDYPQELQPRQRNRQASFEQIEKISNRIDPELLGENRLASDGAPVIGSDLVVESGNGRIMAIRKAYRQGTAENYRSWLKDNAPYFGLNPNDIEAIKKPVLVRERLTDVDRVQFTSEANEASVALMSSTENAMNDATKISNDMLRLYNPEQSLETNGMFISAFSNNVVPDNERGSFIQADGRISKTGFERITNALIAKAYGKTEILSKLNEQYDDNVKNISDALVNAAPKIAIFENGGFRQDLSIKDDIVQAIFSLARIRSNKQTVDEFLNQLSLFDDISNEAKRLLLFFDKNKRSKKVISTALTRYAELAMEQGRPDDSQVTIPGLEDSIPHENKMNLLKKAMREADAAFKPNENLIQNSVTAKSNSKNDSKGIHTKNFKLFFGDWENNPNTASKVVDDFGKPLVVYHGTNAQVKPGETFPFSVFEVDKGQLYGDVNTQDTGAWFHSNKKAAKTYGKTVYEVYLDIRNPYIVSVNKNNQQQILRKKEQIVRDVKAGKYGQGYDGVIFANIEDVKHYFDATSADDVMGDVYVVFRPEQIKSATHNNGNYSRNEQNIFRQNKNDNQQSSSKEAERVRLDFKQQAIHAGRPEQEAEYLSQIFIAGANFFSQYADLSIGDYYDSKHLSFFFDDDKTQSNNRGNTEFIPRITDDNGNIIQDEQVIIRMFQNANASTPVHELGHFFLKELRDLFSAGKLKGQALQDWVTLSQWLGVDDIDFNSRLNDSQRASWRNAHEKLATGFEKYVMTGKAPTPALKRAFEAFKRWLTAIYNSIRNIRYQGSDGLEHSFSVSPDVTAVFDRILSSPDNSLSSTRDNSDASNNTEYNIGNEAYAQNVKHGSGYIFEDKKFDFHRIGSGRGRNYEVWGASFYEDEAMANKFRRTGLKNNGRGNIHISYGEKEFSAPADSNSQWLNPPNDNIHLDVLNDVRFMALQYPGIKPESIKRDLRRNYEEALKRVKDPKQRKILHQKIAYATYIKDITFSDTQHGNVYDFDIPEDNELLNFDTSIKNQSPDVQRAVLSVMNALNDWNVPLKGRKEGTIWFGNVESGRSFYTVVVNAMKQYLRNSSFNHQLYGTVNDPRMAASLLLDSFGIKGVYHKGLGTGKGREFIIWNDEAAKFLGVHGDAEEFYNSNQRNREAQDEVQQETQPQPLSHEANQDNTQDNTPEVISDNSSTSNNLTPSDNTSIAQELERKGRDDTSIFLVTGLIKNENGQWQAQSRQGSIKNRNKPPAGFRKELQRLTDKAAVKDEHGNVIEIDRSKLSANEQYKLDFIHRKLYETTLQDSIDDDELFDAYPQLKNVKYNERILPKGVKAITALENGEYRITVNSRLNSKNAYSALIDEVQRVIQNIEGLTEIGNSQDDSAQSESYNQFIGRDAAERLDKQEGTTYRMDNFNTARNMELAGIHPHNIWLATGWGRGIDRKWRYEILDGKLNRAKRKTLRDLNNMIQRLAIKCQGDPALLDAEDRRHLNSAYTRLAFNSLQDILDAPELFDAYPQLRSVIVSEEFLGDEIAGAAESAHLIRINTTLNNEQYHNTLLHETQHIIQALEGFATGTNDKTLETLAQNLTGTKDSIPANSYLAKSLKRRAEAIYRAASPKLRRKFQELRRQQSSLSEKQFNSLINQTLSRHEAETFREFNEAANTAEMHRNGNNKPIHITPIDIYRQNAGENEARNVERRKNLSLIERRLNPPDITEDIPRSNQFITDSKGTPLNKTSHNTTSEAYNQSIDNDSDSWSDTVDRFINGELNRHNDGNMLHVMNTPDVFTLAGMERLPIEIRLDNIHKILLRKHHISPETLKQIPMALADPVMIFKSEHDIARKRDSRVILTELKEKDSQGKERSIIAAITLGKSNLSKGYSINELTTVYKKDTSSKQNLTPDEDVFDWINRTFKDGNPMNLLLYINKQKARQGAISSGLSPMVFDTLDSLDESIPDEHDLDNLKLKESESYYQIGTKRKKDMDNALIHHRPDMNQQQRTHAIDEIEKLGESVSQGGNTKVEKTATHWLLNGHIILPEDNYKILDAIRICEQQHLDPMRFDDPNVILAQYTIKETKAEKRINPDNIPEFSNRVDYPNGISVYNVEDSREGQAAVRRIIDTHWGEDANPWCLAARTDDGTLDNAWEYWNNYNSIPKRIAFKDGKLLAFSASDSDEVTWWDREDNPSSGIPFSVKQNGNTFEFSHNEENGKTCKVREILRDGTEREWFENGQLGREILPDRTLHDWFENGQLEREALPDGTIRVFYKNGQLAKEALPDGTKREWFENGQLKREVLPDRTLRMFYENGQLKEELLPDRTGHRWYDNGQLEYETLPDRTLHWWYENGHLKNELSPDGTSREWYENGKLHTEQLPDGTYRQWYDNGQLHFEMLPNGTMREWDEHGQPINGAFSDSEVYHQPISNTREALKNWLKGIAGSARNIFSSSPANNSNQSNYQNLQFENEDTEKRYVESRKGVQKQGIVQRIKNSTLSLLKSLRGDFPELSGDEAAKKGLLFAKEQFRLLHRRRFATVHEAMSSFTRNLRGLSEHQKDLFARKRLLDDLMWRKQNSPDAELPFGFNDDMLQREHKRFSDMVEQDDKVSQAIKDEESTMSKISGEFIRLAGQLGIQLDDVLRNPHYYRHTILEYANAAALGYAKNRFRFNDASLQQLVDSELSKIMRRDYLKRFKGSPLDINTNYIQANGEVRAQMLTDIEVMKTLLEIKKKYDIAPKLRDKLRKIFAEHQNVSDSEVHSQSDNDSSLSDVLPDGYSLWDPVGSRLISSANSTSENIISMAIDDASNSSGLPIDKIFSFLGDFGENALNRLCVIPSEVADALSSMAKKRDRGILGEAARTLTDWWKKIVLFSPTRNLKYNFRNFTGDLDAVISGNPKALHFFARAAKELTDYYRTHNATQDLQDYIERSGGMRIESLNMDNAGLKKLQDNPSLFSSLKDLSLKDMPAEAWNLIKDFFTKEQNFTAWREHILRYATYLSYKQDMDNNDGSPLSWGASIPDEVLAVDDIRDRAYKMSNELLGAYDQISDTGKQLRDMLIPFWSWQEVNLKRYYRLIKNGLSGKNPSGLAKRLLLAKSARIPFYAISAADTFGKIALLTLITQAFNRFVMGDDDDELPPDVKYKPHITLGKVNGKVYYFDRIGSLGDATDWLNLDNLFLDAKELRNGQLSMSDYMKKVVQAPIGKFLNSVNPFFRLPYEVMLGRSLFPNPSRPTNIQDSKKYIAQAFGLNWPYKAISGEPHSNWDEFRNLFVYSAEADEAAYFYSLDKVREFQERILGKSFNGFATSKRGQILRKLKTALRLHDKKTAREAILEYKKIAGNKKDSSKIEQGLKTSLNSMNPLYGLGEDEKKKFMRWLDAEDKKYLQRAERYFHSLTDRFLR